MVAPETFQPMNDRVLLRRMQEPQVGLIITPDAYKQLSWRAEVVSVGNKCEEVLPGMKVVFHGKWSDWEDDPEGLVLVQEADIIGVLES